MPSDPVRLSRPVSPTELSTRATRRHLLKGAVGGAAAVALAGGRPGLGVAQGYQGDFVVVSVQEVEQAAPTIAAIEAANPGVKVVWRYIPSERFTELFTAAQVAGDQIDLMDLNGQDLRRYAIGGQLQDLSGIAYKDRFRQVALDTYTIQGKLWALPRGGIGGFTFFVNLKALQAIGVETPPETYDELLAMAPDLRQAGIAPFVHPGKNIYLWPVWQFWAYAQTSRNTAVEGTARVLTGEAKFTDPEHVAALEILHRFARDGMFIDGVNSLDNDAAWLQFTQGKAAFFYWHAGSIGTYREGDFPELDMSLIPPVRAVEDPNVARQLPGGTGSALGRYAEAGAERADLAASVMDLMTADPTIKALNELNGDPVSVNANVVASEDPLALLYAEQCSPNQITYLDWYWPPEITRAFQENQQAIVTGDSSPEQAAESIQSTLDDLFADGYEFLT